MVTTTYPTLLVISAGILGAAVLLFIRTKQPDVNRSPLIAATATLLETVQERSPR